MYELFCGSRILLLYMAILEYVSIVNFIWYRKQGNRTDGVMLNDAIFVSFNTKEFHKMVAPTKIKIVIFQPSVQLPVYNWIYKKIKRLVYFVTSIVMK